MQVLPPDPSFVETPERKFRCLVCENILREPMQTACGHRMCKPCADTLLASGDGTAVCPAEEEECKALDETFDVFPDIGFRRELGLLAVYCTYQPCGCPEKLPWKELQNHVEDCYFRTLQEFGLQYCGNREAGCLYFVAQSGDDSALRKHMEGCDFKPEVCTYCQVELPHCHMNVHHQESCLNYPVPCPYTCGIAVMQRNELEEHLVICELKPRPCSYSKMGCEFEGTKTVVARHEKELLEDHLKLVTQYCGTLESKCEHLEDRHQHFSDERTQWKSREGELETVIQKEREEKEQMKDLITLQDNKLKHVQKYVVDQSQKIISLTDGRKQLEKQHRWMEAEMVRQKAELSEEFNNKMKLMNNVIMQLWSKTETMETSSEDLANIFDVQNDSPLGKLLQQEACSYDGMLVWKIRNYSVHKAEAVNGTKSSMCSQPFYTTRQGYKMCAKMYLNGDRDHKGTHVSLFFAMMKGEYDGLQSWPFQQQVALMICDQKEGRHLQAIFKPNAQSSAFRKPCGKVVTAKEYPLRIPHEMLEGPNSQYLVDDTLEIKVVVDIRGLQPARRPLPFSDDSTESSEELSD